MQNTPEILGDVIKAARQRSGITMEELAYKVGVTERYLYRIENENKKPSFDVLFRLIRELSIAPDAIFYPEKDIPNHTLEQLVHALYTCDEQTILLTNAFLNVLLKTS
ncbi:MAG: helix-turn-helix domain-containing protein [Lachnospiraceae bacterium]